MLSDARINELKRFAGEIRMETLKAISHVPSGHLGGALSMAEVLSVLYGSSSSATPKSPSGRTATGWFFPRDTVVPVCMQR